MGIKRIVDTSFWTDGKVDEFSPEDKYFMLYLLTNPFSTQLGIYEISIKQVAFQLGYTADVIRVLIDRFENKYGMIIFSHATNEIAIKNFLRHSIIKGGAPVRDCLIKEIKKVKNKELIARVFSHIKGSESLNETVKNIILEYEEKNGTLYYSNEKQNENDNDNEVSYPDTGNESYNDSLEPPILIDTEPFKQLARKVTEQGKKVTCQDIVDLYHSICISFPKVSSISDSRRKAIKARLNTYTLDAFRTLFEKAERSSFLKGKNDRNWSANFDWLIKDSKMPLVIEGTYDDKPQQTRYTRQEKKPNWMQPSMEMGQEELDAIRKMMGTGQTVDNDPSVAEEAEAMQQRLREKYGRKEA